MAAKKTASSTEKKPVKKAPAATPQKDTGTENAELKAKVADLEASNSNLKSQVEEAQAAETKAKQDLASANNQTPDKRNAGQESSFQRDRANDPLHENQVVPESYEPLLDRDNSGFAVAKQFYNNPEPPAHARPADLDPRVNGPFLDDVEEIRAEQSRAGHFVSERRKKRSKKVQEAVKEQQKDK